MKSKVFNVTYTKAIGGNGTLQVKARNEAEALKNAKFLCFTGRDFRNAVEAAVPYTKPSRLGFAGSHRSN